jgi:hypothetical protein
MIDKRTKLTSVQVSEIIELLDAGSTLGAIASKFRISDSHVHRIKVAHNKGHVKLKASPLSSCMNHIKNGWPFRRVSWPEKLYYYYAIDEPSPWFIKVNSENGCELIVYTLDLSLDDLMAKDWVVLTWDSINKNV